MRSLLVVVVIAQLLTGPASAQDRPLFEPFRIGYLSGDGRGERLKADGALERGLRRIGLIASWQSFDSGLTALRSLHAGELDIALDIAQHDVILAKLEDLSMVFVAQRTNDGHPDDERTSPDDSFARYTLASAFYADHREDALLVVVRALRNTIDSRTAHAERLVKIAQAGAGTKAGDSIDFVTRPLLAANQHRIDRQCALGQFPAPVDLTDVNYWLPFANVSTR
jgi:hypothetical protein